MTAEPTFSLDPGTQTPAQVATLSDGLGGGAGRGGSQNGPLVVVQQPRNTAPPRPAPRTSRANAGNSLRNGYAAISHTVSGETAAIGTGFLVAGPVGAVIGGAVMPVTAAVVMWRARRAEHDENTNRNSPATTNPGSGSHRDGNGHNRNNSGGRHLAPNGHHDGRDKANKQRKLAPKDPVADRLNKAGKGLLDKLKPSKNTKDHGTKNRSSNDTHPKQHSGGSTKETGPKSLKDGLKGLIKNRGKQPSSDRPWRDRGGKPKRPSKDKNGQGRGKNSGDADSTTAPDGLGPLHPTGRNGGGNTPPRPDYEPDEYIDAELVDDDLPPYPDTAPDDVIDGEAVDEDRIALIRAMREKARRRQAVAAGKKAAAQAARDGDKGDPRTVRRQVTARANHVIDLEMHHQNHLLDLTAAAETPRSTPMNYPAIPAGPGAARTAGVAVARRIDHRGTTAYLILRAMADQLAHGLRSDDDADMADHIVELTGIPNMCKNLSVAVKEAAQALSRTAPLHPTVIKHLENAAVAARTAGVMAESIMTVFVQAHREDIIRVLDPRLGEERWNIRNARGTLDAAKLRAAIATANTNRRALPAGTPAQTGAGNRSSKLVPVSDASTKKLIDLMKNFNRGHMVTVLSEVNGTQAGVNAVADSITKLYKRMQDTWPTENVVDETVNRTAGQVRRVADEIRKAVKAAEKAHERELRLNSVGRAGKGAYAERKWDVAGRASTSN